MHKYTLDVVNLTDVLIALGVTDLDEWGTIIDAGFRHISFGDASFTLIHATEAWHYIEDGLEALGWDDDTVDHAKIKFHCVVGNAFINLEE